MNYPNIRRQSQAQASPPRSSKRTSSRRASAPALKASNEAYVVKHQQKQEPPAITDARNGLASQLYYHGVLPRLETDEMLQKHGDFLVRLSMKGADSDFVISVNWEQEHYHFKLLYDKNAWRIDDKRFSSIPEMVQYHHSQSVPLTKKFEVCLLSPRKREYWELDNNQVKLKEKLGQGQYGEVYKGILHLPDDSIEVAVKVCHQQMNPAEKNKFVQEAFFMKSFNHPNIVKLYGVAATREPVMIVMEYINGGALDEYLKANKTRVSTRLKLKLVVMAARGMEYLEQNHCIHRDLAARNCLVDNMKTLRIADFGLSRKGDEYTIQSEEVKIPIRWTAPEALLTCTFSTKSDVWSFGILTWEIYSEAETPYPDFDENKEVIKFLKTGQRLSQPESMPPEVNVIMQQCWLPDPIARPSFKAITEAIEKIYFAADFSTNINTKSTQPVASLPIKSKSMTGKRRISIVKK